MDIFTKIAERRIKEALDRGDFKNLPLKGKPIELENNQGIPHHLRLAYKILHNAGMIPMEMQLKKEINSLQNAIKSCTDKTKLLSLQKDLSDKRTEYNILIEKHIKNARNS